jgi:hypothetical protein
MVEKKIERRVRDKERSDVAAARDTGCNRAPPGIGDIRHDVINAYTYSLYVICDMLLRVLCMLCACHEVSQQQTTL